MRPLNLIAVFSLTTALGCASSMFGGTSDTKFNASVPEVYNASLAALEQENLPIIRKDVTKAEAQIRSEYPNGSSINISIDRVSPEVSEANVRVGALGNDYRAYDMMKSIEEQVAKVTDGQNRQRKMQGT